MTTDLVEADPAPSTWSAPRVAAGARLGRRGRRGRRGSARGRHGRAVAAGDGAARSRATPSPLAPLLRPVRYYLASRLVVLAAAIVAAVLYPSLDVVRSFGSVWDGRWYLLIAQHGYPDRMYQEGLGSRWAFFPAFPAVIRGVGSSTRLSLPDAAIWRRSCSGFTATVAVWLVVARRFGARVAGRATPLARLLPALVHLVVRLHGGTLPDGGRGHPLRPPAPLVDHGGVAGLRGRPHPQHRGGRRHLRAGRRPAGGLARAKAAAVRRRGDHPARPGGLPGLQLGHGRHPLRLFGVAVQVSGRDSTSCGSRSRCGRWPRF